MPHIPSIEERTAAAVELGLIEPGADLPPRLQAKMARVLGLAEQLQVEQSVPVRDPIAAILDARQRLADADIPAEDARLILTAIAPEIWRATTGAAHAR